MNQATGHPPSRAQITRRHLLSGLSVALGSLTSGFHLWGRVPQQEIKQTPSSSANQDRTSLHQEVHLAASPQRLYDVFLDSKQFAAFTGMPADIDPKAGGALAMFGGLIVGRNVELVPAARIVQAWRATHWGEGVFSIARFDLKSAGTGTKLALDHKGFPAGQFDHLDDGWRGHYWEPLAKYLA